MRSILFYLLSMVLAVTLLAFLLFDITWFSACFSAQAAGWAELRVMGYNSMHTAREMDRACHAR